MNTYQIKKIDTYGIKTLNDYADAIDNAAPVIVNGFAAVCEYIGGKPFKQRHGYSCNKGRYDYIVERVI